MFRKKYILLFLLPFFSCSFFLSSPQHELAGKSQLKNNINKESVFALVKKTADWQIKNFTYSSKGNLHDYGIDSWTNATLYIGMLQWGALTKENNSYLEWIKNIGLTTGWKLPDNFINNPQYSLYHADELCVAQTYLKLYEIFKDKDMLSDSQQRIDWIINNPPNPDMRYSNKQSLTWSDAIFMSPPAYAQLASITGNIKYLDFMDRQIKQAYDYLFDKKEKLFYRDDSYFNKREANGQKVFWGRGNGWVIAGIANILKQIPPKSKYRFFYENLLKQLAERLSELQDNNGFWHASLLDPDSYPSPETSATALIAYGIAYGVNAGILPFDKYYPVLKKSWDALESSVDRDGKLGWVQPIGASPKEVTQDMTATYGVGAFLLAGSEIYRMILNN